MGFLPECKKLQLLNFRIMIVQIGEKGKHFIFISNYGEGYIARVYLFFIEFLD